MRHRINYLSNEDIETLQEIITGFRNNRQNTFIDPSNRNYAVTSEEYFVRLDENDWIDAGPPVTSFTGTKVFEAKVYRLVLPSDSAIENATTQQRVFQPIINPDGSYYKVWVHNIHRVHIGRPVKDQYLNPAGAYMKITRSRWGGWVFDFPTDFLIVRAKAPPGGIPARIGNVCGTASCEIIDTVINRTMGTTGKYITVENWATSVVASKGDNYFIAAFTNGSWIVLSDDCGASASSPGGGGGTGPGPLGMSVPTSGSTSPAPSGISSTPSSSTIQDFGSLATNFGTSVVSTVSSTFDTLVLSTIAAIEVTPTLSVTLSTFGLTAVAEMPAEVTGETSYTLASIGLTTAVDAGIVATLSTTLDSLILVNIGEYTAPEYFHQMTKTLDAITVSSTTTFTGIE